ncbi:MAG TPA: universal stress protein [Streptosporangiaceae bacterium]|nr:universal stress protein [Streptosporangiaceae bacterium]
MTGTTHGILLGYDGSPSSERALRWALREARWRDAVLTVCHAWGPGYAQEPSGGDGTPHPSQLTGEVVLAPALRLARSIMDPQAVRPLLAAGPAAQVLCDRSRDADMVVVGSRGRGGFAGLLLGSVSQQVSAHARGRVVVVRGHWHGAAEYVPGPVVAGADGSAASRAALAFAAEEAMLRAVPLLAVSALADTAGGLGGAARMEEAAGRDIARQEKEHPELTIQWQVTPGQPRTALLAAAGGAQLLVVGSRGRGGIMGMPLGSVSQAMLHHCPCPVAVVHPC